MNGVKEGGANISPFFFDRGSPALRTNAAGLSKAYAGQSSNALREASAKYRITPADVERLRLRMQ